MWIKDGGSRRASSSIKEKTTQNGRRTARSSRESQERQKKIDCAGCAREKNQKKVNDKSKEGGGVLLTETVLTEGKSEKSGSSSK